MKRFLICFTSCMMAVFVGCTDIVEGLPDGTEGGSENVESADKLPFTYEVVDVTASSVTIKGRLEVTLEDLPYSSLGVYFSDDDIFNISSSNCSFDVIFDSDHNFTIILDSLFSETTYRYCLYSKVHTTEYLGDVSEFTTLVAPTVDISLNGASNCYIISVAGGYKFKAVKGNSDDTVGEVASIEVLWESFGTDVQPNVGDLVENVEYSEGYIYFDTPRTFREGNAVIAAKDADGIILWSWHIWFTDEPQGQVYFNNAGTMMDRNLGATSAVPGDASTMGLLYQWGRKDPFLGSSSFSESVEQCSTISWPSPVLSTLSTGTIEYATSNPTTFLTVDFFENPNNDWYYTGSRTTDDTRWTTSDSDKSIYDPCPVGWRIPDGGDNGVWSMALGLSESVYDSSLFDSANQGINFSGKFGSASTIWYPTTSYRNDGNGVLDDAQFDGVCWSASPRSSSAHGLLIFPDGFSPSFRNGRAFGYSVRCVSE